MAISTRIDLDFSVIFDILRLYNAMEFFEVLKRRKAVRSYIAGKSIPGKDITCILDAINLAPSAHNLQSYKIFTAKSPETVLRVFPVFFNQRSDFIRNASLILIFCADPRNSQKEFGKRGKNLYALQDATIAATYGMLSAAALGYSTCWVGNFRDKEMKKVLNTGLTPVAAVIIGFSYDDPRRPLRKSLNLLAEDIREVQTRH